MREKGRLVFSNLPQERITPAYAGKSRFEFFNKFIIWDHPRLCGEKKNISLEMIVILGSPPPMRGKVRQIRHLLFQIRITPAYAGKSLFRRMGHNQRRDHPRLCGEKMVFCAGVGCWWGSPPPMRGKVLPMPASVRRTGITPAYAGKSYPPLVTRR